MTDTGTWANELVPKFYEPTPEARFVDDPAHYAEKHGLINNHTVDAREQIGAWRWHGLQEYRESILPIIQTHKTIDFGGGAGPVGYGSTVVDAGHELNKSLWDIVGDYSCLFSSHTLEHIPHLVSFLGCVLYRLQRPAVVITFVPGSTLTHLRAANFPHHCHTFCLSTDTDRHDSWIPLDVMFSCNGFTLQHAARCQDGNLFSIATLEDMPQ